MRGLQIVDRLGELQPIVTLPLCSRAFKKVPAHARHPPPNSLPSTPRLKFNDFNNHRARLLTLHRCRAQLLGTSRSPGSDRSRAPTHGQQNTPFPPPSLITNLHPPIRSRASPHPIQTPSQRNRFDALRGHRASFHLPRFRYQKPRNPPKMETIASTSLHSMCSLSSFPFQPTSLAFHPRNIIDLSIARQAT